MAPTRICFVCTGNICRSPTAEGVLRSLAAEAGIGEDRLVIDSAGLGDWHAGELPDPRTRAAAKRHGVDLTHRARQLVPGDFVRFELLVGMDATHLAHMTAMAERVRAPIATLCLLRSFDPASPPGAEVPDPYTGRREDFDRVFELCRVSCQGLLTHVMAPRSSSRVTAERGDGQR